MVVKKIPMRTCVITKEKCPKKDLIRIVRTPELSVVIDESGKLNGRGAYIKKDKEVILKAQKTGVLNRHLEVDVPNSIYEDLLQLVGDINE